MLLLLVLATWAMQLVGQWIRQQGRHKRVLQQQGQLVSSLHQMLLLLLTRWWTR
jgi:hypothetical protein